MSLLYIERRETPYPYKGDSLSLLYIEEVGTLCRGERLLLYREERGERLLLYKEERVSLLRYREERDDFSIERARRLSSI